MSHIESYYIRMIRSALTSLAPGVKRTKDQFDQPAPRLGEFAISPTVDRTPITALVDVATGPA